MPSLTIKRIPSGLYRRLKASAAAHRRSLNSEILVCLDQALGARRRDPAELLARADALRARLTAMPPLSEDALAAVKSEGRP